MQDWVPLGWTGWISLQSKGPSRVFSNTTVQKHQFLATFMVQHWRRQWQPTPVLLPGNSHGQRSLVGCNPWGRKESDTSEQVHFHFWLSCIGEGNGNPLQCSCLENPRDGGAWWAVIDGVAQSRTRLKQPSCSSSSMVQHSQSYMTTGKTITLTRRTFIGKVMSLVFNMLSRLVIAFLPRSKCLLISWVQSPTAVILETKKIKSITVFIYFLSISHEVMVPDGMILVFWILSFKPSFSLSSFSFNKRIISSSFLSVISMVSSVYLRLLIFLLAILIQSCASSSPAFLMMYSAYKLKKQGDNIQHWCTAFLIGNQAVFTWPVLTVASWPAFRFLRRQVSWSGIPISLRIFHRLFLWFTVKGFGIVNKAVVFLELSCFLYEPTDVGNLIYGSSAFCKSSLTVWKFTVHILLEPD